MVHSCIVPGCKNRSNKEDCKGIKFYRLPIRNEELLETCLLLICRRRHEVTVNSRICSDHFIDGIKKNEYDLPQIFPWQKSTLVNDRRLTPQQIVFHDHSYCSQHYQPSSYLTPTTTSDIICLHNTTATYITATTDASTITDPSLHSATSFRIELFVENDEAIHFYTGFETYQILTACFKFLGEVVNHLQYVGSTSKSTTHAETRGAPRALSPLNEFFLVLCRLRCALMINDLAYRFGISTSTVSRIFTTWINFLYFKFKDVNLWPSRQEINNCMPQSFKISYPTTRCIIDATEIFIQMPSDPQAQQLTFSSYKNHNTFKVLVAITPTGGISFVSKLYGGNISDRQLTEMSGLLDLLEPGDSVMADRGFTIADLLDTRGVTLNIPPMIINDQFTEKELTATRRIATLRIHIERAIGRIKNFKILTDVPNSMARVADQIFYVCAMLSNFHGPLCC